MKRSIWIALALCAFTGSTVLAATKKPVAPPKPVVLSGTVSRIVDGDTLWLKTEAEAPVVVRIEGIDAPESCQVGGPEATAALNALALGRSVTVKVSAHDDYGRTVGKVFDGDKDIGDRMVRDGMAWSTRFQYDRGPYVAEERMALALKRGLHAPGGAIQPRDFRKQHGPCEGAKAASPVAPTAAPATATALPAATPNTTAPAQVVATASTFRCDGRTYCRQMTSCAEATWFLNHCPGVKMDGNRDGIPCEQQWCGRH